MSEHSDADICPNCGNLANTYTDRKPFSYTDYECLHCGLVIHANIMYMDLDEFNERRKDDDLKPLTELPKQSKEF